MLPITKEIRKSIKETKEIAINEIQRLQKENARLQQQQKQLIEALKYYAEPSDQYCGHCDNVSYGVDDGEVARAALQQIQGVEEK